MPFNPLVSIVIPVYNGSDYLKEAIDSALAQTYLNVEIIVVNDGSNDNGVTREIALSYGQKIRYFEKPNGGVASALNLGIQNMKGEYFSWLSHDDLYYPNKIEEQVRFIESIGVDIIVYSDFDLINEKGLVFSVSNLPPIDPYQFRFWLTLESRLHGCTLLIPKHAFLTLGRFDENLLTAQDYDLWFKFSSSYRFIHLAKVLISSRQHSNQGTKSMPNTVMIECNNLHYKFFSELASNDLFNYQIKDLVKLAKSFYQRRFYLASSLSFSSILKKQPSLKYSISCIFYKICSDFGIYIRSLKHKSFSQILL
jgi:Glycosyltransferases involved in cell wall biogenesis